MALRQLMITSLQHPLVKHLVKLRDSSQYRAEQKRVLLQGTKVIREVASSVKVRKIITAGPQVELLADEVIHASQSVIDKISGLKTSEGIAAEVDMPPWSDLEGANRILALDGIADPGNLGTLIRTALAFGWDSIYLLPGCCDPYNDKALRAAMGATFKVRLGQGSAAALQTMTNADGWNLLVADLNGTPPQKVQGRILLVLGNEANGPSEAIKRFCQSVTLPMQGDIESLNVAVAGSVLMYYYSALLPT